MDNTNYTTAVRVWSGALPVDKVKIQNGKEFNLINLPFYYVGAIDQVLADLKFE